MDARRHDAPLGSTPPCDRIHAPHHTRRCSPRPPRHGGDGARPGRNRCARELVERPISQGHAPGRQRVGATGTLPLAGGMELSARRSLGRQPLPAHISRRIPPPLESRHALQPGRRSPRDQGHVRLTPGNGQPNCLHAQAVDRRASRDLAGRSRRPNGHCARRGRAVPRAWPPSGQS